MCAKGSYRLLIYVVPRECFNSCTKAVRPLGRKSPPCYKRISINKLILTLGGIQRKFISIHFGISPSNSLSTSLSLIPSLFLDNSPFYFLFLWFPTIQRESIARSLKIWHKFMKILRWVVRPKSTMFFHICWAYANDSCHIRKHLHGILLHVV